VTVLLADKGSISPQLGTLNLLNVGWSRTRLAPIHGVIGSLITPPHAVAAFFRVERAYCDRSVELVFELFTAEGAPVDLPAPAGPQTMRVVQSIYIQSLGDLGRAFPGVGNYLIEIAPGLAIPPGGYEWRVQLAGVSNPHWCAPFYVSPPDIKEGTMPSPSPSPAQV
jgi:hypothetical protein